MKGARNTGSPPVNEPRESEDFDDLDGLIDQLEAEEREDQRLSQQASLYEQAPKRGDRV